MRNINEFNIPAGNSYGYEILYFGVNLILMFEYRLSFDIKVQNSVNEIEILILGRKDIPAIGDADGDGKCDYPIGDKCSVSKEGDNHRGYMGFRNSTDTTELVDNGVIDIVVKSWDTK